MPMPRSINPWRQVLTETRSTAAKSPGWAEQINWERLYKVLRLTAKWATSGAPPSFDCGVSAEDIVGQTLTEFWCSPKKLGWKPPKSGHFSPVETQKSLEVFLIVVVKRRAIDHLRREKHVAGSLDDDQR